uniref:SufB n=1 Tax=Coccophora langsdorfii TaxID=74099 RepID=A0A1N7TJH8_9PHAE|nr:sufB [Coccophora langsdorfii]ANS72222.1 sufB [Coccophora langsdorfii]
MNNTNTNLQQFVNQPYKYGFFTNIETETLPPGLNEKIVRNILRKNNEPDYMFKFRIGALKRWRKIKKPTWSKLDLLDIDYQKIIYYSVPKKKKTLANLDEIDPEIKKTFDKLGISLNEQKRLANVAVDAIFDSVSIATTFKEELEKYGVIFCSISKAIKNYPHLVKYFLGTVIPPGDNFFAALNSTVFTDGSFCYIPKNLRCPLELSTYFRINNKEAGQFERTLIIAEEGSYVSYLEGCTAPQYDTNQLHAAIVELIALKNAEIKYSTVQNWYAGDKNGIGGIFNFVTKRGLAIGENSKISWTQVETGSAITWKYPSCVLIGDYSKGEFYSVALTTNRQQADTGTKMIHIGANTTSQIISKGVSGGYSKNSYRGLVKIGTKALNSRNFSQCDSLLFGINAQANTFPYIQVQNSTSKIEHEASTSKVGEEQIFYLLQRGINTEDAVTLILTGFCKVVFNELPIEFATEVEHLLRIKLEGSVG